MYFYYARNFKGGWSPQTSADRPSDKGPDGVKRKIQQIVELPEQHRSLPLAELEELYPLQ